MIASVFAVDEHDINKEQIFSINIQSLVSVRSFVSHGLLIILG